MKKAAKVMIISLSSVGVVGAGGLTAYLVLKNQNPEYSFNLNGAGVMSLDFGSAYQEKGAKAIYNNQDISSQVSINYYKNSKSGEKVEEIDTHEAITYFVKYSIHHETMDETLFRQVNIASSFSVTFLELGNKYAGDSIYIKVNDIDILIDAGSRTGSADTICNYLNEEGNVEDGTLEYVIVTHAHQDHIAAFVGSDTKNNGVFDKFKIDNIIQFSKTNATTQIYSKYCAKRDQLVEGGTKLLLAGDLVDTKTNEFILSDDVSFTVLDQKFYHEKTSDENDYSVVTLFKQNDFNYLFTGDLEAAGEASLVELNELPECVLFKAGHHGSYTASNEVLLDVIDPEIVCVSCCAGTDEYTKTPENQFPAQAAINRIGVHTEKVYVTSVTDGDDGFTSMNGNITFKSNGNTYDIRGSNNDTILKETEWFKANRTWPSL